MPIGQIAWNKGKTGIYSKETLEKMRVARLGKKPSPMSPEQKEALRKANLGNKNWLGRKHTPETIQKMKESQKKIGCPWFKGKKQTLEHIAKRIMFGEKNPMWKGGITPVLVKIRGSVEYKLWRTAVFTRDNFTCIWCGDKNHKGRGKTIVLQADHIKPFSEFPALRFAIDNGRTLCFDCHKKTDNYGRPKKNG